MFGFGTKKPETTTDRTRIVGLDLNASRVRGLSTAAGRGRTLLLEDPAEELPLVLHLDRRPLGVGRVGVSACRRTPHLVCSNFLPQLGQPRLWQASRGTVTPETALAAVFEKLRGPVSGETETAGVAVPSYLTAAQVKSFTEIATKAKLPVRGTTTMPLAVAAHRAAWVLGTSTEPVAEDAGRPDWVVPMHPLAFGPSAVVIVDADEFALSAAVVGVESNEVKVLASTAWPRASLKLWADKLIDALSDRCVRLCRRDPRDSADAEQSLFEQLDLALDQTHLGQPVRLNIRSEHWYQDLVHQPEEFDSFCSNLAVIGCEGVRELVKSANLPVPPRAIWLTPAAARLPGLAASLYKSSPEQTELLSLPANAVAEAVAALVPRWVSGELPRGHADAGIPLVPVTREVSPTSGRYTVK